MMRCAECKGKGMCGLPRCPVVSRFHAQVAAKPADSYQGSSPSVFIGSYGYPDVRGGPLLINDTDNPPDWIRNNLGMDEIVNLRARTIRGSAGLHTVAGSLQEIALSARPLDVDVYFERPVSFSLNFDGTVAPVGFTGAVRKMDLIGSASVGRAVDRITSDTDIGATDAAIALNNDGVDVYQITKLMTAGLLGKRRKFVPTRWAITAVDDTLSNSLKKEIARYPPVDEIRVFSGEIYGNRIACILVPGDWKYEMIEIWGKQTLWGGEEEVIVQDREGMIKHGYSPISGAYYSARLAVSEYLQSIRRCARVIVIRSVSSEYWAPLGTWVIREAARKAMANPPVSASSLDAAVLHTAAVIGSDRWVPYSTLIPELRTQRTLFQFVESRQG
jgi:DNA repair protein NreA